MDYLVASGPKIRAHLNTKDWSRRLAILVTSDRPPSSRRLLPGSRRGHSPTQRHGRKHPTDPRSYGRNPMVGIFPTRHQPIVSAKPRQLSRGHFEPRYLLGRAPESDYLCRGDSESSMRLRVYPSFCRIRLKTSRHGKPTTFTQHCLGIWGTMNTALRPHAPVVFSGPGHCESFRK